MQPTVVKKDKQNSNRNAAKLKSEIDQTPNATDEEKAVAKAKVDEAVTTAKNAMESTTK